MVAKPLAPFGLEASMLHLGALKYRRLRVLGVAVSSPGLTTVTAPDVRAPTAPVLGTPTSILATSLTVPLTTASTDIGGSGLATGLRQRATDAAFTTNLVA
jgi:hypothetical protein